MTRDLYQFLTHYNLECFIETQDKTAFCLDLLGISLINAGHDNALAMADELIDLFNAEIEDINYEAKYWAEENARLD